MEKHMNRILEIDTENMVAVVQPAVINMELQRAVEEVAILPQQTQQVRSTPYLAGNCE